ncbi:MAG: mucoidy inhibitor MuiA family protein [Fluviicola sp.]
MFEKLTDFVDPNSVQLKCSENATILSIRLRKNFDDVSIQKQDVDKLNDKRKVLENEEQKLRDEYYVLLKDEEILNLNKQFGSQQQGVKIAELKEASTFFHAKNTEIRVRKAQLEDEIEAIIRKINTIEQEISTRRSLPVINYTEIEVELEVQKAGETNFEFSYITPNASWKPYYDMRSSGIGSPILLEAKGLVTQNTGIEWKNIKLVLSTNDPYDNTQEPLISQWNLNYYTPVPQRQIVQRVRPVYDYSGEVIHGEVLDQVTGEPLAFAKIAMNSNQSNYVMSDISGKFSFTVPRNEQGFQVSYLGYTSQGLSINSPYVKIALYPEDVAMEALPESDYWSGNGESLEADEVQVTAYRIPGVQSTITREDIKRMPKRKVKSVAATVGGVNQEFYNTPIAAAQQKDLRMEYVIETPFTIPSDNSDHRVAIAVYTMNANYEYHAVPKLDKNVYLVAQVNGWEKLNLLPGESNLYFDGTYIGKSYVDVNSTKDTMSFSLGQDKKVLVERTRSQEMSKTRLIGSRYKYDVTWDFVVRNNGGAEIPMIVKDHFPVSVNEDIKVKEGEFEGATKEENSHILTWKFTLKKGETKKFKFDYSVDYGRNQPVYLE